MTFTHVLLGLGYVVVAGVSYWIGKKGVKAVEGDVQNAAQDVKKV